jgi:autotransporter-associated beta strand protein
MDDTGSGSSTLALGTSQSIASLTGAASSNVTLGANTLTIGTTSGNTTFAGRISGTGKLVKDGNSTQVLSGANAYTGTTTINSGTLTAAAANATGSTSKVTINNGGSFLVTANNAIGTSTAIELNGGTLAFGADGYNGTVGALTLSANSILDLGGSDNGWFSTSAASTGATRMPCWRSTTGPAQRQWQGGNGNNKDQIYFDNSLLSQQQLQRISFYTGFGTGFTGNAFQITSGTYNREIIPVPEPGTWITSVVPPRRPRPAPPAPQQARRDLARKRIFRQDDRM